MNRNYRNHHWLTIKDVIDIRAWQKIQDNFSAVTGICLRTVDANGKTITSPSNEPRLCGELSPESSLVSKICANCLPTFLGGRGVVDRNLSFQCLPGVHNFIAPLRIDRKEALGYLLIGPVILVMRKPKEDFHQAAEELNLDLDYLWNALVEIKVMSFQGMQSLVELIKDVGEYTLKLAYQNAMRERELVMTLELPKLSRLLNVLLDVAFQISGADIGSIMFIEKGKNELTIKVSKGLPEEIVKNTRVKFGDGIAGMAAKEGRPFLINDQTDDNRIRPYLNRPNLNSAMVLPLRVKNQVLGVMNLAASKSSTTARFNPDNLNLMNKLADLVSVAIAQ